MSGKCQGENLVKEKWPLMLLAALTLAGDHTAATCVSVVDKAVRVRKKTYSNRLTVAHGRHDKPPPQA